MRRLPAKATDKVLFLGATVSLAGNTYGVPSEEFWAALVGTRPWFPILMLVLVGVFGALTPFEAWSERSRASQNVTIRRQTLTSFGHILRVVTDSAEEINIRDVGLHVWRKRRTLSAPLRGQLIRVATYRLGTTPVNRGFAPTKGVGVVGLCWKCDSEIGRDVEELSRKLTTREEFEAYAAENVEEVMNLDWETFQRVSHRGAVLATPIRNGRNKFVGCLSLDASHGYHTLNKDEIREEMNSLCVVLGQDGFEHV